MARPSRYATVFDALAAGPVVEHTPAGVLITLRVPVDAASEVLVGHYPGFPIMPGVLVLDCLRQALDSVFGSGLRPAVVERIRFLSPLLPGDELGLTIAVAGDPWSGPLAVRAQGRRADGRLAVDVRGRWERRAADA